MNNSEQNTGAVIKISDVESKKHMRKEKVVKRRVGTVTMGICLIFFGALLSVQLFFPECDLVYILKFSPFILIMLGIEVLYRYFRHGGEGITYDFLSFLVCFTLIGFALCCCFAFFYLEKYAEYYLPWLG